MIPIAVPLAVALACAFAGQSATAAPPANGIASPKEPKTYQDLYLSPYEGQYIQYDDNPNVYIASEESYDLAPSDTDDLLTKEIALLKRWQDFNDLHPEYDLPEYTDRQLFLIRILGLGTGHRKYSSEDQNPLPPPPMSIYRADLLPQTDKNPTVKKSNDEKAENTDKIENKIEPEKKSKEEIELESLQKNERMKTFALRPNDFGYFDITERGQTSLDKNSIQPRKIRQNPNLSRMKTLVTENLEELRQGFTDKDTGSTQKPHHIHFVESEKTKKEMAIISKTLLASIVASLSLAIVGFIFGWYTIFHVPNISKKARAAADVDYPTYGVTGPTVDVSGDRKLAQLAHMYHYQHQKQQIIAMESCLGRNGSISDPDSEEENEEGDYTVYECPGFATTGNMEVKNPLFNEEPTPATPEKCEVVQPQPKE